MGTDASEGGARKPRNVSAGDKAELRRLLRQQRAALEPARRDAASRLICRQTAQLLRDQLAQVVLTFSSFGSEVSTGPLIDELAGGGSRILLPVVRDGAILAVDYEPGDHLVPTAYGPLEPEQAHPADPRDIEAVVLPGLAFDRRGGRLGYGGGYFDRFLCALSPRPLLVAVAFAVQLLPSVPTSSDDVPVDIVVTEAEVVRCSDRAGGGTGGT